jgi:fatty-acyl-CoA synthase
VERLQTPWGRSGADLLFIYTGGTTGMPKGVMWEHDTLLRAHVAMSEAFDGDDATLEEMLDAVHASRPRAPCCPLMHGTGMLLAFGQLTEGGTVVLQPDAADLVKIAALAA